MMSGDPAVPSLKLTGSGETVDNDNATAKPTHLAKVGGKYVPKTRSLIRDHGRFSVKNELSMSCPSCCFIADQNNLPPPFLDCPAEYSSSLTPIKAGRSPSHLV